MPLSKVYIVARSRIEANRYASEQGLTRGEFVVIAESGQLKSARHGEIRLVPGWETGPKRHSIRAALRYARVPVIDLAAEVPAEDEGPTDRDLEVAYRYNGLLDLEASAAAEDEARLESIFSNPEDPDPPVDAEEQAKYDLAVSSLHGEATREAEPSEDPAPAPEVKRRRRRCDKCGTLHFRGEECPAEAGA